MDTTLMEHDSTEDRIVTVSTPKLRLQRDTLAELAADLAGQFELQPLLERILGHAVGLLGCDSGSICTVEETAGIYRKEVDLGVSCHSGMTFPLSEGVTGEIMRVRGPVILDEYSQVIGGHIAGPEKESLHAVIGVPIVWDGNIVGSCVVFCRDQTRSFNEEDANLLEVFAKHASIAIRNSRLYAEAKKRAGEAAVATERERAVRDVHDTVGRGLAAVLLHLDRAEREAADSGNELLESLRSASESAREALAESRRTVLGLNPTLLDGRSLADAIGLELGWAESTARLSGQFVILGEPRELIPDTAHSLFKLTQEALTNVIVHAHARNVRVGLIYGSSTISVLVEDNGRGFDSSAAVEDVREPGTEVPWVKLGLQGMIARARHSGGSVIVDSTPGWGTKVRFDLPYAPQGPPDAVRSRWRVLLVHDQPLVRAGLVRLLGLVEPDIQVVGEIAGAEQVAAGYRLLRPDVVIADVHMPGMDGAHLMAELRHYDPDAAVVFLADTTADTCAFDAVQNGARGFVPRAVDADGLVRAVVAAARGDALMPGDMFTTVTSVASLDDERQLTEREREICELVVAGLPNKIIATQLHISVKTVERHVGSLLRKTGAQNRTMLASLSSAHRH